MTAEMLRAGYHARMQMWTGDGRPAAVPGVWFRVPDDTPGYPYVHCFGSRNYSDPPDNTGIGEQYLRDQYGNRKGRNWYRGEPPAPYTGDHFCGLPSSFEFGGVWGVTAPIGVLPNGMAACCTPATEVMQGGSAEGGDWPMSGLLRAWTGGEEEGGSWAAGLLTVVEWIGGEAEGGNWPRQEQIVHTAAGGEGEGGTSPQGLQACVYAAGGEGEGGIAPQGLQACVYAAGGEGEGGAAVQGIAVAQVAQGGEGEGGTAPQGLQAVRYAAGGEGEGGSAIFLKIAQVAEGGEGEGGSSPQGTGSVVYAHGGEGEGGTSPVVVIAQVAAGGEGEGGSAVFLAVSQRAEGGEGEGGSAVFLKVSQLAAGGEGEGGHSPVVECPHFGCPVAGGVAVEWSCLLVSNYPNGGIIAGPVVIDLVDECRWTGQAGFSLVQMFPQLPVMEIGWTLRGVTTVGVIPTGQFLGQGDNVLRDPFSTKAIVIQPVTCKLVPTTACAQPIPGILFGTAKAGPVGCCQQSARFDYNGNKQRWELSKPLCGCAPGDLWLSWNGVTWDFGGTGVVHPFFVSYQCNPLIIKVAYASSLCGCLDQAEVWFTP